MEISKIDQKSRNQRIIRSHETILIPFNKICGRRLLLSGAHIFKTIKYGKDKRAQFLRKDTVLRTNGYSKLKNGKFWAKLIACGYNQISGVIFSKKYSPVTCDTIAKI